MQLTAYLYHLLPLWLTLFLGHGVPLLATLAIGYKYRRELKPSVALQFAVLTVITAYLVWYTAKINIFPDGGRSVSMFIEFPAMLAVACTLVGRKALPSAPVFAVAFLALYLVDLGCGMKLFGFKEMFGGIGGGGLMDGLLLGPLFAVVAAKVSALDLKTKAV